MELNWSAKWIWAEAFKGKPAEGHELVYFRRSFTVPDEASGNLRLVVNVSADSRYRLYLNGRSVSVGPCKGDAWTHYYETVDLSGLIQPGNNDACG